jgi:hypothetical protein
MVMRVRGRKQDPTPTTRFDSWSHEDLVGALETQILDLSDATRSYPRCDAQQKEQVLSLMLPKLQTAHQVVLALQRRVANDKRS